MAVVNCIRKIIKQKELKNGVKLVMAQIEGDNFYAVLLTKDDRIIKSCCYCCKGQTRSGYLKLLNKEYNKLKKESWQNQDSIS